MASSNYNPLPSDWLVQGKYLYVQAAGSDGSDGTVAGRHVRWAFMDNLGANHLPKGTASAGSGPYSTTIGFNNPTDYVNIYRAELGAFVRDVFSHEVFESRFSIY